MPTITKTGDNNLKVTITNNQLITLYQADKKIASGCHLIRDLSKIKNVPAGAVSGLTTSGGGELQALSQTTTDLIDAALNDYSNHPDVRLPRERAKLVINISCAYDKYEYLREQDYNNDIGFHASPAAGKEIETAKQALADFDLTHPDIAAKIAKEEAEKTARQIQSAINA